MTPTAPLVTAGRKRNATATGQEERRRTCENAPPESTASTLIATMSSAVLRVRSGRPPAAGDQARTAAASTPRRARAYEEAGLFGIGMLEPLAECNQGDGRQRNHATTRSASLCVPVRGGEERARHARVLLDETAAHGGRYGGGTVGRRRASRTVLACVFTVVSPQVQLFAICWRLLPAAIRCRISCSRGVSAGASLCLRRRISETRPAATSVGLRSPHVRTRGRHRRSAHGAPLRDEPAAPVSSALVDQRCP